MSHVICVEYYTIFLEFVHHISIDFYKLLHHINIDFYELLHYILISGFCTVSVLISDF